MTVVAGAVGVLVIALSVLGMVVTGIGYEPPAPISSDQPWTAALRASVDILTFVVIIVAGLALRWRPKLAVWPLGAAVLLTGVKVAYDFLVTNADVARLREMLYADMAIAAVVAVAVFAHLVACDEEVALVELGKPRPSV